jgi:hypothetical protein
VDTIVVVAGGLLVGAVFADALMTTLAVSAGAGPLTKHLLGASWRVLLTLHRQDKESSFLSVAGAGMLIATVLTWVLGLWAGWSLILGGSGSIVDATSLRPAGASDVVYYAGFTIFTLGTGDFVAADPGWRVTTAIASFSGLFLITLAITYLISVVSAVVTRRTLAVQVQGLGESPGEIVANGWCSDRFGSMFQQQLVALGSDVATSAEQHLAYPVLHYFHASSRQLAAPVAMASLDDALTILREGVVPEHRPERGALVPLQSSIGRYLATAGGTAWVPKAGPPPEPALDEVRGAGVPLIDEAGMSEALRRHAERRTQLHQLVLSDGWSWSGSTTSTGR